MQLLEKLWAVKGWNSLSWESAQFGNLCVESQDFISAVAEKIQVNDSYLQQFSSLVALSWFILEIGEKESSDISATHGLFSSYFNYFFPNLLGGNIPYFHVGCFSVSSTHRNLGCCTTNPWDDPARKMAQKNGWKYWKQGGGKIMLVLWSRTCQMCAQDHIFTLGQGLRAEMCPQPELSCKTSLLLSEKCFSPSSSSFWILSVKIHNINVVDAGICCKPVWSWVPKHQPF